MSCHYPTVRMPGCPVEFDEDDYSWTAEEAEAFILDREDELEILLPFIEYDGDLINMLWENDLLKWRPPLWRYDIEFHKAGEPMTKANPNNIKAAMKTMKQKYGVRFCFCSPADTGPLVCRLLEVPDGSETSCSADPPVSHDG